MGYNYARTAMASMASVVLAASAMIALAGPSSAAEAAPVSDAASQGGYTAEDIATIRDRMTDLGIDAQTQAGLVEKLLTGELLDSTMRENAVRTLTETRGGYVRTTTVYADGSRSVTEAPRVLTNSRPGAVIPLGIGVSGCSTEQSVGAWWYSGCKVYSSDALSDVGFIIDYKLTNIASWSAEVRDLHGTYCYAVGAGTNVSCSGKIERAVQSGQLKARGSASYTMRTGGGVIAKQGVLWIEVWGMNRSVKMT